MKFIIILICLFYCNSYTNAQKLYRVEKNGLYGYINPENQVIIDCKYIHAYTDTIINLGFVFDQQTNKITCFNSKGKKLFNVFIVDNGPDYIQEGLFRIIDDKNRIGFADTLGNIIINPKFKFAFPFKEEKAKATLVGQSKNVSKFNNEIHYWESHFWFYINKKGEKVIQ